MTEDEAKTKWCPAARVSGMDGTNGNRHILHGDDMNGANRCMASACMAWQWAGYRANDGTWVRKTAGGLWAPEGADGYCGLAGQLQ